MRQSANTMDILQSYYLVRLIDIELSKKEMINTQAIEKSIRAAEIEFWRVNFSDLKKSLEDAGWSLEYIYLDAKTKH